ncbi:carbohydrate-binding module family 13 protein [Pluteus cervinus]|uniref:Carbohydrate-binding module family 13 protein n=1 Tax=Pluteus cervinus TaxID=181527 RepID=A0ACD3AHY7_9AGAR|nr:carbohydrate-binding module family 13 protein [Pluteus cervinus]
MISSTTFILTILATSLSATANVIRAGTTNSTKCISAIDLSLQNGTPVGIFDCNTSYNEQWVIKKGETKVQVAGTSFCLDAGSSPQNGVGLKVWQCYDNLPAQDWYWTDDNRIALKDQGFCVDVPNGNLTSGAQLQIWKCTDNNNNQVWTQ